MEFGNFNVIFFYDLGVHFDIWNNLGKKIFFKNFQNRRGDHYDFDAKCTKIHMVPPTIWKIFEENFFSEIIPDIKMYVQIVKENHVKISKFHRTTSQ